MSEQPIHRKDRCKYIRYTTRGGNGSLLENTGLFASAYKLRNSKSLPDSEQQELLECLRWFESHVQLAHIEERSDLDQQAICWYKNPSRFNPSVNEELSSCSELPDHSGNSAQEALIQTEALAGILRRHGFLVQVEHTNQPGVIISEDDVQVAAIPAQNIWRYLYLQFQIWWQRNIPSIN